ncbi:cysteine proteinase [Aureobasidium sp. EXF-10727]|nr:cysteine proteinase [Aureobasidium sp. EXF-10727]
MSSNPRPGYTAAQIHQYYNRINLPEKYRHEPGNASTKIASKTSTGLEFLSALQRYNLANIPFENLDLHYSTHHSISIDAQEIFDKIVVGRDGKKGRGGYCMVNNALFANVLRGLGFSVTSHGARISSSVSAAKDIPLDQVTFSGFSHMVNLVSFPDNPALKYHVDVGFGSGGPTFPVPLQHDEKGKLNIQPTQWARVIHSPIPGTASDQKFWVYEKRNGDQNWSPCYCFAETEFLESDFKVMNYWTSTSKDSWFTQMPVCLKMLLDDSGDKIVGHMHILKTDFKKRVGEDALISRELKSEDERIKVIKEEFGIPLNEEERKGIHGMVSEIA